MDPRIEEVNQVDCVVNEENAGLLASALEGVPFEDSYQWEEVEVDTAEKRARNGISEEEVARKRLRPHLVFFFFFFISYSHEAYLDYGGVHF
jgi:hypothetical protein